MGQFSNIQTFIDNFTTDERDSEKLLKLMFFTAYSRLGRTLYFPFYNVAFAKDNKDFDYIFNNGNKKYHFSIFSDRKLQKFDKKVLESPKRMQEYFMRSLKLACSLDLVNPRIAIGNSVDGILSLLIIYQEKVEDRIVDKVIDYSKNLIMNKEDYYELFKFVELNVVDKVDLYNIYYFMGKFNNYNYLFEYLLFTKEIFRELSKRDMFAFLGKKFDRKGININNYILFGNDSDSLFFRAEDNENHMKFAEIIKELDDFTENPQSESKHITYDQENDRYVFKERKFGYFTFGLLSNLIEDKELQKKLLSKDRYGDCHVNSNLLARSLCDEDKKSAYIVGGKFKENEIDYFYHTWVEIDDKNIVLDFNHNLVMNRDKYYKLFEIVPISKTLATEMEEIIKVVEDDADLCMHEMELNYFGFELMRDLKKNERIFRN